MKSSVLFLLFLILNSSLVFGQEEQAIEELLETIEDATDYDRKKWEQIDSLKGELRNISGVNLTSQYKLNHALLQEYKVFKQDSAFMYGLKTRNLAIQLDSMPLIADAVVNLAEVSVSAGMYKEALDFLESIKPDEIPVNLRSFYYGVLGRCYSDMAEYSNLPYFTSTYNNLASTYHNLALSLAQTDTYYHSSLKGFIEYRKGNWKKSLEIMKFLLSQDISLREKAVVNSVLGHIYAQINKKDKAIYHLSKASIADIKTSTKETLAMIRLAELLFEKEEIKNASTFIQKANDDAVFYGAQQRKIRVGAILPLIEEQVVDKIEQQRARLYRQNLLLIFLLLFVIALAFVIYTQVRNLKKAKNTIVEAHERLQKKNEQIIAGSEQIKQNNAELNKLNYLLLEANKIKEEYIGFFFTQDADIFEKFSDFKSKLEDNLKDENLEKIKFTVNNLNLKREKEKLLQNFDEAFIKLFPDFVEDFNSLLRPEHNIQLKKGQILNKELRIFALIRLGITHNEIIAQILGYSVNSIYAYKTKIRNKSIVDKKDFDQELLEITNLKL